MAVTAKALFSALQAQAIETTQYIVPVGTRTILDKFTGTNVTATTATLTVKLVAGGGSPSVTNVVVSAKTLQPNESYTFPELVGHVLSAGDILSTLASVGAAINIRSSGREVT